ncbi:hypothetical protein [Streptomyces sp. NPDC055099]
MSTRQRTADLRAFTTIVGTPAALIALNPPSDQVIASTSAAAVLYSALAPGRRHAAVTGLRGTAWR